MKISSNTFCHNYAQHSSRSFVAAFVETLLFVVTIVVVTTSLAQAQCTDWDQSMKVVGNVDTIHQAAAVTLQGDIAFVADMNSGLQLVDISDPLQPALLGRANTPYQANHVVVSGDFAFVADGDSGLQVVDVSNVAVPALVASINTGYQAFWVGISGTTLVVGGTDTVELYDVSDPVNLFWLASVAVPSNFQGYEIVGDYVYVCPGSTHSDFTILDISNPSSPQTLMPTAISAFSSRLVVSGDYLYCGGSSFIIMDVSNPVAPVELGEVALSGINLDDCRGIDVENDVVYMAAGDDGVVTIDVSDPNLPVYTGLVRTYDWSGDVAVAGQFAFVADDSEGLTTIDVTYPKGMLEIGRTDVSLVRAIDYQNGYSYVANPSNMQVIDVSNPTAPVQVGNLNDANLESADLVVSGSYAYVVGDGLHVIDITDSAMPAEVTNLSGLQNLEHVAIDGTLMITASANGDIYVLDISTPDAPVLIGQVNVGGNTGSLLLQGSYVFTVVKSGANRSLVTVDFSNPILPQVVASTPRSGLRAHDIVAIDDQAYVSCDVGFYLYDLSNPLSLEYQSTVVLNNPATDLAIAGNLLLTNGGLRGIRAFNVSIPESPVLFAELMSIDVVSWIQVIEGLIGTVQVDQFVIVQEPCPPPEDCDANGLDDAVEIAGHPSLDFNGDGILDICQAGQGISDVPQGLPHAVVLHEPAPNPFNPRTVVAFDLDLERKVDLTVYDVSGRLVRHLVRGEIGRMGRNEFVWDGRDDSGNVMASGVYFVGLNTSDDFLTKRMVLLK